jgi:dihydroorotase-like cyclic amidohydrolase
VTDLLVRGGIVVTTEGSARADIAVEEGRITAVEPDLGARAASAGEVVDASGLLVLPGVVDVHTHTRVATDERPDRFFDDSVAAAFGGTTTFLAFNNPGTGSSPAATRSLMTGLREWRAATADDAAVDVAPSLVLTAAHEDPAAQITRAIDAGVPTFKAFMVYDFGLDDAAILRALDATGRGGGMLQVHCENRAILEALTARHLAAGEIGPRYHASSRPPYVEAEATGRAIALARAARAPLYVVHLSSADALAQVRTARAEGLPVFAETCPVYLTLTEDRYAGDPEAAARYVISPPLRPADHPGREAELARVLRSGLERRAGDRDASLDRVRRGRGRRADDRGADGRPALHDAGAAVRLHDQGRVGRRARCGHRAVRPGRPPDDPGGRPPPLQRLHAVRGPRGPRRGPVHDPPRELRRARRGVRRAPGLRPVRGAVDPEAPLTALGRTRRAGSGRGQSSRPYASGVRNSTKSSARTRPSRRAAASATRPRSRPIRASSSSRIRR